MDTNRWQEIEEVKERGDLNCGMRVTMLSQRSEKYERRNVS